MSHLTAAFVGDGRLLVRCAERWTERGHRIVAVLSACDVVRAWAAAAGLPALPPEAVPDAVDYLFSVGNRRLATPALLARARLGAVNYHNAPLPALAGFHAPTWAILGGRAAHGVTWHRMTAEADAGEVFAQVPLAVEARDTAYTLEARCGEAALAGFELVLGQIDGGGLAGRPQEGVRSFHGWSDRPATLGLVDWDAGVAAADRLGRALAFGPLDNPVALPALWDGAGPLWADEVRDAGPAGAAAAGLAPGTVCEVGDGVAVVAAAGGGAVRLAGLAAADGAPLTAAALGARGVAAGRRLPAPAAGLLAALGAFDARVRASERFWARRLAERLTAAGGGPPPAAGAAARAAAPVVPAAEAAAALGARDRDGRVAAWAAALALYVAGRAALEAADGAEAPDAVWLDVDLGVVPDALRPFYADRVPARVAVASDAPVARVAEAAAAELALVARRGSYARDLARRTGALRTAALRTAALRGAGVATFGAPAALVVGAGPATDAPLELRLDADAAHAEVRTADGDGAGGAPAVAERLAALVDLVLRRPDLPAGAAPLVAPAEAAALLGAWHGTAAPYDAGRGVHEFFEAQAARTPDRAAVVFGDESVTYAELDAGADAVAARLRAAGVTPGALVAVCVERSVALVAALLGVLKAGAAYVPLDPAYPRERLRLMVDDARPAALLTRRALAGRVDAAGAAVVHVEACAPDAGAAAAAAPARPALGADALAYVIYTSGSTGRPKGVMVPHRAVANFFAAMDRVLRVGERPAGRPGVWLALTSVSFDISVLELFWTLARGFTVVVHQESDRASLAEAAEVRAPAGAAAAPRGGPGFGLFYFAADAARPADAYRLLVEGAKWADANGFDAVWTPERHFHAFGGLYPNPAVTSAALATVTSRVQLRAGSVVLPLHDPVRVAEEWSVVDNLSGGRVGLSFASGWHADDFVFRPEQYARRREALREGIATVRALWRGEPVRRPNGAGAQVEVRVLPRPVQVEPPLWVASAGNVETFREAGAMGVNVLTNLLGQTRAELRAKVDAYREARRAAGHAGPGVVSVMVHTFVGPDAERVRETVRGPFRRYLATALDLVRVAPAAFPAFRAPSGAAAADLARDVAAVSAEDMEALLDHAFERYVDEAGLFGTPAEALARVRALEAAGADEIACLVDFGVDADVVLAHLPYLRAVADAARAPAAPPEPPTVAEQVRRHGVTHLQCTPSFARLLAEEPGALAAFGALEALVLGGEPLPAELAERLCAAAGGRVLNMYGPTETTVWSTAAEVRRGAPVTIGRPVANTVVRLLDARRRLVPAGAVGEVYLGGAGVTRGYLNRPELTAERFVDDPFRPGERLYRTGDLARYAPDGALLFVGRADQQVKVSGYRIELGEIEAVLGGCPGVAEVAVTADVHPTAGTRLVAHVVPGAGGPAPGPAPVRPGAADWAADRAADRVAGWAGVWDAAYEEGPLADPRFDTRGWAHTATGAPVAEAAMREWVAHTAARLLELRPRRVLELGCGTGLLMHRLLPHVERYTGADVSAAALARAAGALGADERPRAALVRAAADGPEAFAAAAAAGPVDLVVLNSVAQYFPDAAYLRRVLARAVAAVADGGHVYVGDVRSLALLDAFHAAVEAARAGAGAPAAAVREAAARRAAREAELVVDPDFFRALAAEVPRVGGVRVRLKRGRDRNEMTCFRYDVVLRVGPPAGDGAEPARHPAGDVAAVRALLAARPGAVWAADLPNDRVAGALAAAAALRAGDDAALAAAFADHAPAGVDPEALETLDPDYAVEVTFARSGSPAHCDALFWRRDRARPAAHDRRGPDRAGPHANVPAAGAAGRGPAAGDPAARAEAWRRHVAERLPAYMVPSAFVEHARFPLTPNGKVDRRALAARRPDAPAAPAAPNDPPPGAPGARPHVAPRATAPAGAAADAERVVAGVWAELLGAEAAPDRNIFDLGANSLLAVQAARRIGERLGRAVPLVTLFRFPTVRRLAEHLAGAAPGREAAGGADVRHPGVDAPGGGSPGGAAPGGAAPAERRLDALERRRLARARPTGG